MHEVYQEKTSFLTNRGLYCYKMMSFGLKNVGATYQRLVNKMFQEQIGRKIEVYVDDRLVSSCQDFLDFPLRLRMTLPLGISYPKCSLILASVTMRSKSILRIHWELRERDHGSNLSCLNSSDIGRFFPCEIKSDESSSKGE